MSPFLSSLLTALFIFVASFTIFYSMYTLIIFLVGIKGHDCHGKIDFPKRVPFVSLIIPVKNEEKVISRLLESLLRIDYPKDRMEILIVEDGSFDRTKEVCLYYASSWPNLIRYFHKPTSSGKPAALNFALQMAQGEIIGVLDADSVPDESFLRRAIEHFEESEAIAIQGMTKSINARTNMLTIVASFEEAIWFKALMNGKERLGLFIPLTGSCQFIKAEALRELGGWNESSLAEDVDLAVRLAKRGHRVKFCWDVVSLQETSSKLSQMFKQRSRWYRGYIETAVKYWSLLKGLDRVQLDAKLSLLGPVFLTFNFASYLISWLALLSFASPLLKALASFLIAIFSIPLLTVGFHLAYLNKSKKAFLLWLPFICTYWLFQTMIATYAIFSLILRRPKVWVKTEKTGLVDDLTSNMIKTRSLA
jgi:cellulose synthase/poly-beta-1,6-N-acetylglucosamine synthase-like glycosyltransferase